MGIVELLYALFGAMFGAGISWMALRARQAGSVIAERTKLATKLEAAEMALEDALRDSTRFHERAVMAEAENKSLIERVKEQQEQIKFEFKNTATTIFEEFTTKFSTQSEKKIGDILNPLRERIGDFQKLVTDKFGEQGKEQHTLKAEIEKIVLQTDSLTKALRGDVKAQGNWGEVMLEKILEEAGLRKDKDYTAQGAEMGLAGAEGNRLKPDIIVNLPDNKHIIIDSKVSLASYERFCGGSDEVAQGLHMREFLKSVRAHVNGLGSKNYQDIDKLMTPDFVFLFMPIEGAYSMAVQKDPELQSYAWSRRIALVCPTTLFASLRIVASLWRIERQNKYAEEISRRGGLLYDKFVGFVEDMQRIGNQLSTVQKSYGDAMTKLSDGTGHLISQAEKLKRLGVKTSKSLPHELVGDEEDEIPQLATAEN
jgi:DNA recombination protein RmuC